MRPALFIAFLTVLFSLLLPSVGFARNGRTDDDRVPTSSWSDFISRDKPEGAAAAPRNLNASAVATTVVLNSSKFDSGAACTANSWTSVDITAQTGDYWHVDDFAQTNALGSLGGNTITGAGITIAPIQGSKSMWMGQRIPPAGPVDTIHCSYLELPGYGNQWDQLFCSKACLSTAGGPTPNLDIAFIMKLDVQPSYDGTKFEYTTDCAGNTGWTSVHVGPWFGTPAGISGYGTLRVANSIPVGPGPVRVRLHFTSDYAWSNQDGLYPGLGVVVDSLSWEGTPVEDFEGEAIGAHSSEDWESCNDPGFGNYLALFKKGSGANFEDPCLPNIGCYWAALQGSTDFYSCGSPSQPAQKVVPYKNPNGTPGNFLIRGTQYIANEIWSPFIPLSGSGSEFRLRYTVYRDLPLDNLVFHYWRVRAIPASGCPGKWSDSGNYYYGDSKDWALVEYSIGSRLDLTAGTSMQVSLGVIDLCSAWCGVLGSGACHSPAPYFDSVKVLRVSTTGPQWEVRDVDMLQDTFSANGTLTGTARADAALDIKPAASASITPGDSAVVFFLADPKYANGVNTLSSGLLADPVVSTFVGRHKTKRQAYMYVSVWPQGQAAKTGAALSEGPGGQANRYPFMGTQVIGGNTWTKIRMDYTYKGTAFNPGDGHPAPNAPPYIASRFNVDLNDNVFTPGDTVCYFFSASSTDGTSYFSTEFGTTTDINAVAANAMEFTVLPAGGYNHGGNILYVDGADGLGNQPYFDGAFMQLGLSQRVDRYDVRDPAAGTNNRLSARVVAAQLSAAYRIILWDTGSLSVTLGDGSGTPLKTDDYGLLSLFLGGLTQPGGVYLGGDDLPEQLNGYAGAGAVSFRSTYMPFILINNNHRLAPTNLNISPTAVFWPGRMFNDNFVVFGGCPLLNDFDVMGESGGSRVEMSYNVSSDPNGAVLSTPGVNAHAVMSGFSFANIRDDELDGLSDKAVFLYRILQTFAPYFCIDCVPAGPLAPVNSLAQNYPNPFNPQTAIAFTLKERGAVSLKVYDVGGALVRELVNDTRIAGPHTVKWDGRDESGQQVASGVYFYKLVAGDFRSTKKMVLLK